MIKTLNTLVEQSRTWKAVILFEDAVHQLHTTHTWRAIQRVWWKHTKQLESNTGRSRLTILWAVNPISLQFSRVTTEAMCNMELCKQLIDQIASDYEAEIQNNTPVYMVLDNARYQRATIVQEYAKEKKVILTFLPPYCPHLNLIERLWKWLKKKIRNKYFATFKLFSDTIHTILWSLHLYNHELATELNPAFRII